VSNDTYQNLLYENDGDGTFSRGPSREWLVRRRGGWFRRSASVAAVLLLAACGGDAPPVDSAEVVRVRTQGLIALQQDRLDDAQNRFEALVAMMPREATGYAYLGLVALRRGELALAEERIREGLERNDQDPGVYLMLAAVLAERGDEGAARAVLREALALDSTHLESLWALAELDRGATGGTELERRVESLARLVETAPANLAALFAWARSLVGADRADQAAGALEGLRQQLPSFPAPIADAFDEALVLLQGGNAAGAASPLDEFGAFFVASGAYQAGYAELRGPAREMVGMLDLTFSHGFSLVVQEEEAVLAALDFVDGSAIAGLEEHPLREAPAAIALADVDGDGDTDLVTGAADGSGGALHRVDLGLFVDASASSGLGSAPPTEAIAPADFDNDGFVDLAFTGSQGTRLFRNSGVGVFADVTDAAGLVAGGAGTAALWADLDHDGDLDLVDGGDLGMRVHRNDGDGSFTEVSTTWGLSAPAGVGSFAFGDIDDDGDLDLLVTGRDGRILLFDNLREGSFAEVAAARGLGEVSGVNAMAVADFDADGALDLLLGSDSGTRLRPNRGDGSFGAAAWTGAPAEVLEVLDFDNDGRMDALLLGAGAAVLVRNEGGFEFADFSDKLPSGARRLAAAQALDYNEDGDVDLVVARQAGGFTLLRNDGGNANHYLRIELEGLAAGSGRNNRDGIGARIEVTAGDLYQVHVVTRPTMIVGLGSHRKADVIRIEWTNGVPQDIYFPGTDQDLEEQLLKGSCPMLFTWNGERFEFQKDVMWKSALGMPMGIQGNQGTRSYGPAPASREYVRIPGDQLVARGGRYELRITEELWETIYIDEVELLAIDHPADSDVFVDERFVPSNLPVDFEPIVVHDARPPLAAVDGRGNDVLGALLERDHVYVTGVLPGRFQGVAEPHEIVMDLGEAAARADQVRLFLTGWVFPADASLNVAMAQSDAYRMQSPVLEVPDGRGGWSRVLDDVSFPSGKDKTIVLDLTGRLRPDDPRVRVRTNMVVYWDWAFVSMGPAEGELAVRTLEPIDAELVYRGFSPTFRKGGRYGPHWFGYDSVTTGSRWRDLIGSYTRYGDVQPLLTEADDMYVIMNAGDEVRISFDEAELPTLPRGWTRDFVIYTVGWVKDGDLNTATGKTVGPLPFHGMTRYPYGDDESYPADPSHDRYLAEYNTRRVGPDRR